MLEQGVREIIIKNDNIFVADKGTGKLLCLIVTVGPMETVE